MGFSFIHMADIHMDTPFRNRSSNLKKLLRDSMRQSFKSGVDYAVSNKVDGFLIAGDAFDNDTLSFSSEKFLIDQFLILKQAGINVYYAPGNHDPYGVSFRLNHITWPENVHLFKSSVPEAVQVNKDGHKVAVIVGAGHEGKREGRNIAATFPYADGSVPYIGVLHALVSGSSGAGDHEKYAPCTTADLEKKGYSYWALGHIHKRSEVCREPLIVYPGNLTGRNPKETGEKGMYVVNIGDTKNIDASFVSLSPVIWCTFNITGLGDCFNIKDILNRICNELSKEIKSRSLTGGILARISLEGPCPLYKELYSEDNIETLSESIMDEMGFQYVEIVSNCMYRRIDPEKYKNGPHVLGKALKIIDEAKTNDELLIKLMPETLAGLNSDQMEDRIKYLRGLLEGMEIEAAERLLEENGNEN